MNDWVTDSKSIWPAKNLLQQLQAFLEDLTQAWIYFGICHLKQKPNEKQRFITSY